jgi:hypothetical protein
VFGIFGKQNKVSWNLAKFVGSSGVNIPFSDRKQILEKAESLNAQDGVEVQNAVLIILTKYIEGHPDPQFKYLLAQGLVAHVIDNSSKMNWSSEYIQFAMDTANHILEVGE